MFETIQEKTTVVIPTYNEKENIERLIAAIKGSYPLLRIFIVDDNSPDGTGTVADTLAEKYAGVLVIHRSQKSGIGSAYTDAFKVLLADEHILYVVTMDADFSHDPEDLGKFFAHARASDIVVGSRYIPGGRIENWSRWRRALSKYGNVYARTIIRVPVHDMTAGFVLYRRKILEEIIQRGITSNGYAFLIEMKYAAHEIGGRIKEAPITFRERKQGASKLGWRIVIEGVILPVRLRFRSERVVMGRSFQRKVFSRGALSLLIALLCFGTVGFFAHRAVAPDAFVERFSTIARDLAGAIINRSADDARAPRAILGEAGGGVILAQERKKWSQRVDEVGATGAYEEFKAYVLELSRGQQHTLAHLFGELLYEKAGVSGMAVCDQSFDFGCYHSFFGTAVEALGVSILPAFDSACKERFGKAYLPCQHGIGHGVLVFTGGNNLEKALGLCAKLSWQPTGGCGSGVFMEYNFRTMSNAVTGGSYVRPLEHDDWYAPCDVLPRKFQDGCYFEMPQWWESLVYGDYRRIGLLCAGIGEVALREPCFQGAGNYAAPFSNFTLKGSRELCDMMPEEGKVFCRQGASWILSGKGMTKEKVKEVCQGLPVLSQQVCEEKI